MIPKGVLQVKLQHGDNTASFPLYAVDQEGSPLLGLEWLQAIGLEWSKICNVHHLPSACNHPEGHLHLASPPGPAAAQTCGGRCSYAWNSWLSYNH